MVATGIGKAGFLPYAQVGPLPLARMTSLFLFSFSSFGHSAADLQNKLLLDLFKADVIN
jgi:hypothetical protein